MAVVRAVRTLALLAAIAGAVAATAEARRHTPATGLAPIAFDRPAPDFAFDSPVGPTRLAAFQGRPVVINFWATYCEPCTAEIDAFVRLRRTYGDVPVIAISDQAPELTDAFLQARGLDAISVADPERKIFDLYGVTPIPVTLVLAPDGTVSHVSVGELDWPELQAAVERVRPSPPSAPSGAPAT